MGNCYGHHSNSIHDIDRPDKTASNEDTQITKIYIKSIDHEIHHNHHPQHQPQQQRLIHSLPPTTQTDDDSERRSHHSAPHLQPVTPLDNDGEEIDQQPHLTKKRLTVHSKRRSSKGKSLNTLYPSSGSNPSTHNTQQQLNRGSLKNLRSSASSSNGILLSSNNITTTGTTTSTSTTLSPHNGNPIPYQHPHSHQNTHHAHLASQSHFKLHMTPQQSFEIHESEKDHNHSENLHPNHESAGIVNNNFNSTTATTGMSHRKHNSLSLAKLVIPLSHVSSSPMHHLNGNHPYDSKNTSPSTYNTQSYGRTLSNRMVHVHTFNRSTTERQGSIHTPLSMNHNAISQQPHQQPVVEMAPHLSHYYNHSLSLPSPPVLRASVSEGNPPPPNHGSTSPHHPSNISNRSQSFSPSPLQSQRSPEIGTTINSNTTTYQPLHTPNYTAQMIQSYRHQTIHRQLSQHQHPLATSSTTVQSYRSHQHVREGSLGTVTSLNDSIHQYPPVTHELPTHSSFTPHHANSDSSPTSPRTPQIHTPYNNNPNHLNHTNENSVSKQCSIAFHPPYTSRYGGYTPNTHTHLHTTPHHHNPHNHSYSPHSLSTQQTATSPGTVSTNPYSDMLTRSFYKRLDGTIETHTVEIFVNESYGKKQINQYVIEGEIGKGSSAVVKKVLSVVDHKRYAMKIISKSALVKQHGPSSIAKSSGVSGNTHSRQSSQIDPHHRSHTVSYSENFLHHNPLGDHSDMLCEIAIMKKLSHPNIVRLYEVLNDEQNDNIHLIMDYCELGAVMDEDYFDMYQLNECHHPSTGSNSSTNNSMIGNDPLPLHIALRYFRDTISAIDYLHANNVAHRDIKPGNLLLSTDGHVKVSDFGVSMIFTTQGDFTRDMKGSVAFMAPEMVDTRKSKEGYSAKMTDIYALGVTLYGFVYARLPFMDHSIAEVYRLIVEGELIFPETPAIPATLKHLLTRMLDKNPATRIKMSEILVDEWVTDGGKWSIDRSSWMYSADTNHRSSTVSGDSDLNGSGNESVGTGVISDGIDTYKPIGDIRNVTSEEINNAVVKVNKLTMLLKLKSKMQKRATLSRASVNAKKSNFNHSNGIVSTSSALVQSKDFFQQVNDALPSHLKNNKFKIPANNNVVG